MKNQQFRFARSLLLVALSFLLTTTACYNPATQESDKAKQLANSSECRVIQHSLGKSCIPLKPERIIALDIPVILDSLLALDIKPVGTAIDFQGGGRYFPELLPEKVTGIESVGKEGTPSIERMLALKPDLILLLDENAQFYEQLSAIAPTVIIDV